MPMFGVDILPSKSLDLHYRKRDIKAISLILERVEKVLVSWGGEDKIRRQEVSTRRSRLRLEIITLIHDSS